MAATAPASAKLSRWPLWVGLLLVLGPIAVALMSLTGLVSEQEYIDASAYAVLPVGWGIASIFAWLLLRSSGPSANAVAFGCGVIGAAAAAGARWYFFEHLWYHL